MVHTPAPEEDEELPVSSAVVADGGIGVVAFEIVPLTSHQPSSVAVLHDVHHA